jgi:hypothetical protein
MRNNRLTWFTGAPGSKWSGTANILQSIQQLNFNTSDRTSEREYTHTGPTPLARSITHTGVYFGPGHGVGEHWDRLSLLDPASIVREINKEWSDNSYGNLLVKSHFLSHHLDFISETFPDDPIIMIFRPDQKCEQGWFGAGGWNILYPNYRPYYKDDDTMKSMIAEHNKLMLNFCKNKNIIPQKFTRNFLKETFNWTTDDIADTAQREWVDRHIQHTEGTDDVSIAIWNIGKLTNVSVSK